MMLWLRLAPWALAGVLAIVAGLLWWQWEAATERLGAAQQENRQLTVTLQERENALKERAKTDADIRRLAPDDVLRRLQ